MKQLTNKRILLGITGSIAAYKSAELTRLLKKSGADVRIVMTKAATDFITPLTMQALSGHPVHMELLDPVAEAGMGHIELARWADRIIIAPASANLISHLAQGQAVDLLTTLCLATKAPTMLAPAMNQAMWQHPAQQNNIKRLSDHGIQCLGTDEGTQACGDIGPGRMLEPDIILQTIANSFHSNSLDGAHVVITAGPTQEAIDPVRFISNNSSGKMGYALAEAAIEANANVTLISGPTHLDIPDRVEYIPVISAKQMLFEVKKLLPTMTIFIGTAAVADYRPLTFSETKIKKSNDKLLLELIKNPDIINIVSASESKPFTVGFAAETDNIIQHATQKYHNKQLDLIIANDVSDPSIGFDSNENAVTAIWNDAQERFPQMSKQQLARKLITLISQRYPKEK